MRIIRVKDGYRVVTPTGGTIGTRPTMEEAKKLQQQALFKHKKTP